MQDVEEVRNADGRLVCKIDKTTGSIEIQTKGCVTLILRNAHGEFNVVNTKAAS